MSFQPVKETLLNLAMLESGIHAKAKEYNKPRQLHLCRLYTYLCGTEEDPVRLETVKRDTGVYQQSLQLHLKALQAAGFIRMEDGGNSRNLKSLEICDVVNFTLSSSISLLTTILYGNVIEEEIGERKRKVRATKEGFTREDIESDADWKQAEPILLKYFKPTQIDPARFLTDAAIKKSYWRKFNDILDDKDVDFEEYCRWYRKEKYPRMKFNYGLFVLESMVAEFKEDSEPDAYLDVPGSLAKSDHKADVEKTKEWIVNLKPSKKKGMQ